MPMIQTWFGEKHLHAWGKWKKSEEVFEKIYDRVVGKSLVQSRECQECGFTEFNEQIIYAL